MLHIVYFSNLTDNTHRFCLKLQKYVAENGETLNITRIPVKKTDPPVHTDEQYILICPSYGTEKTGHVPPQVKRFLNEESNRTKCVGVIGTGNINFGPEYAIAGNRLAEKLQVPLLHRFELSGFIADIETIYNQLLNLKETNA